MAQALTTTPIAKPARVDSDGRFAFEELPPAAYLVIGTAPGYIDQTVSTGDASQWPRHLIGSNVRITMIRGGVITGQVTNAKGEPMVGVPIHATSTAGMPSIANLFTVGGTETDDRGTYRMYGLTPGQYIVNAGGGGQFGQFNPSGFDIDVPSYYPSATRDTAVPVAVRSGDETSGIDIKYRGGVGHALSGVVLGNVEPGTLGGLITLFLAHAGSASMLSIQIVSTTDPRRAFSFNGVADGEYDLFADYLSSQTDSAVIATKRVTVRGGDVTGIELRLAPLGWIAGTITLDPIKPEAKCDQRNSQVVEIVPTAPRDVPKKNVSPTITALLSPGLGLLSEKGEFAMRNLEAAKYRLNLNLPTESWYLRAINVPGGVAQASAPTTAQSQPPGANPNAGVWQGVITLRPGEKLSGVAVMVGQDAAGLRGRAVAEGTPVREGTRVHLVPVDREQANNILRYSESLVNSDGTFALTNLAPGRYFVLVRVEPPTELEASRPVAWDPAARIKLRREAEAAKAIVELKPCERVVDYTMKPGG
jgi:hypothetical protein